MTDVLEGYEDTAAAAKRLNVTRTRVHALMKDGRLEFIRPGRDYWIKKDSWPQETGVGRRPNWAKPNWTPPPAENIE